jgi:hypothetical protein
MPRWPKSRTNDNHRARIADLVDSFPDGHVFHVEDLVPLLSVKRRRITGKSVGRLLQTEPRVIKKGHGVYEVSHASM